MPGVLVRFVDGVVRVLGDALGVVLQRPPEVRDEAIEIIDRFCVRRVRPVEQHCAAAEERLDVVLDVTEACPN